MAMPAEKLDRRMTFEEYADWQASVEERFEFHDGEIFQMSGATITHSRITSKVNRLLGNALDGGPCEVLSVDMRIGVSSLNKGFFPDASVLCGPADMDPRDPQRTLTNPRVIIEVLSESTEAYDRGEKFRFYKQIPSLDEYILISQRVPVVESFLRQDDGTWSQQTWEGLDATARIRCLGADLPLAALYERVEFEEGGA